jgi:hypothetical protein
MAILTILYYPDPRLYQVAQPVAQVDTTIRRLVNDMAETMYAAPGIGLAIKAGLSPDIVATLKMQKRPEKMAEDEALVYDFVTELTQNKFVSDATFEKARKVFSEQQLVDLTTITGTYVTVAMLLSMAEESVPAGKELPFKPGEP